MSSVMCMSSIVFVYTNCIVPVGCVLYMFSCYNKIIKKKKKKEMKGLQGGLIMCVSVEESNMASTSPKVVAEARLANLSFAFFQK